MAAIQTGLAGSVANVDTQHLPGTTVISVNNCTRANSTTYFQASLFGKGAYEGQVLYFVWALCGCAEIGEGQGVEDCEEEVGVSRPGYDWELECHSAVSTLLMRARE